VWIDKGGGFYGNVSMPSVRLQTSRWNPPMIDESVDGQSIEFGLREMREQIPVK